VKLDGKSKIPASQQPAIVRGFEKAMSLFSFNTQRFADKRGWFTESWNKQRFEEMGIRTEFVQDNHSYSAVAGTIRGLHFQDSPYAQAKLVRCLKGRIFDVAVDLRRESPTYGAWAGIELSSEQGNQLFIPVGFAHGFLTLEPDCEIAYKVDAHYAPDCDAGIAWNDPEIGIEWPLAGLEPVLSEKDAALPTLACAHFAFPYDGKPLLGLKGTT
jgi:dTDP-4-dehydrorhamnose 3,5-epimerase